MRGRALVPAIVASALFAGGIGMGARTAATEARESRIHRLGNLTLTAGSLNATLSNSAWSTKQRGLNRESKLLINSKLIEEHPATFDEKAIDRRTSWLAKRICSLWPGPDAWR